MSRHSHSPVLERQILILGGGIIGCTTAHYLTTHPSYDPATTRITIMEASAHGPARGASGKAGGLIARWAYPKNLVDISYEEHIRLAKTYRGEKWGWRFVECGEWNGSGRHSPSTTPTIDRSDAANSNGALKGLEGNRGVLPADLNWVSEDLTSLYTPMSPSGDTAQVHPYLFTTSMLSLAKSAGVEYMQGKATCILAADGAVTGVEYEELAGQGGDFAEQIFATDVIVCTGAWTPRIRPLDALPISGTRAHSITVLPQFPSSVKQIAPYVLFTSITLANGDTASPEISARPGGEIYICGAGDNAELPDTVDDVQISQAACNSIFSHVAAISEDLRKGRVQRRQACYLPVVTKTAGGNGPIVGAVPGVMGLFIATGHTCWGISNAPGTAKAMAELVLEGKIKCADLSDLDPKNFIDVKFEE